MHGSIRWSCTNAGELTGTFDVQFHTMIQYRTQSVEVWFTYADGSTTNYAFASKDGLEHPVVFASDSFRHARRVTAVFDDGYSAVLRTFEFGNSPS
jgi:hypothetical protein